MANVTVMIHKIIEISNTIVKQNSEIVTFLTGNPAEHALIAAQNTQPRRNARRERRNNVVRRNVRIS